MTPQLPMCLGGRDRQQRRTMQHARNAAGVDPGRSSRPRYRATTLRNICMQQAWCFLALLACGHQGVQAATTSSPAGAAHTRFWCSLASHATSADHSSLSYDYTLNLVSRAAAAIANESHSWGIDWDLVADASGSSQSSSSIQQAATAGQHLKEISACVDDAYSSTQLVSYDTIIGGILPNFKVLAAWWKTAQQPDFPLTLATFTNMDRLKQLQAQCQAWPGPLSVALYQPLLQPSPGPLSEENKRVLRKALVRMMNFINLAESQPGACQLSVLLVYELIGEEAAMPLMPLNALRNLARLQARTPLVTVLDVDLVASKTLYTRFASAQGIALAHETGRQQEILILPAFEMSPAYDTLAWTDTLVSAPDASVMKYMLGQKMVGQVHEVKYIEGHRIADYAKWQSATESYTVKYEFGAEPYVAGSRQLMPWFDERYRGYGWDKTQQLLSMSRWKYTVLPDVYVIHRRHEVSTVMKHHTYNSIQNRPPLLKHIDSMYQAQQRGEQAGEAYQPATNPQLKNCVLKLSWWSTPTLARAQ